MKLVMTLLVRNEIDIVRQNIAYHLAAGVDHIIVTDNGSVDGTLDILSPLAGDGAITLLHEPGEDFSQHRWVTRMALLARDEHRADWILNCDADEFWMIEGDDLKRALPLDPPATAPSTLICQVRNMIRGHDDESDGSWRDTHRARVALPVPLPDGCDPLVDELPCPFHYLEFGAKALVRGAGLGRIDQGNHGAVHSGHSEARPSPILVYHYSVRSRRQFERSVRQTSDGYARNADLCRYMGWQKRRWRRMMEEGGSVDRAIADALPSTAQLAQDIASGVALVDERPRQTLDRMGIAR